jgi:pimeloyl-ACP methyl ester carboxylesterase
MAIDHSFRPDFNQAQDTAMSNSQENRNNPSAEPTFLRISDTVSLRYQKSGDGPSLVLLHTIRTQLEYFRALVPLLAKKFTVYAVDLPGHGFSTVDTSAQYDEPYLRRGVIGFLKTLDLREVTIVGESIGAVIGLTVASEVPDRVKAVYALNPYDYETRYGDGIRRGNWFANLIIGSLQFPVFGAIGASLANAWIIGKIMAGGYADPRKMPADLIAIFDKTGRNPNFHYAERKVLAGWRSWSKARERYSGVEAPVTLIYGDKDWSRIPERNRTQDLLKNCRMITLQNSGHFSSVENPTEVARIILS